MSSRVVAVVTCPVVHVHNIDCADIRDRLLSGEFTRPSLIVPSAKPRVEITKSNQISITEGKDGHKRTHHGTNGETYVTTMTGCVAYDKVKGGRCLYCRLKYKDSPLGIPLKKKRDIWYVTNTNICRPECLRSYVDYIQMTTEERRKTYRLVDEMLVDLYGTNDFPLSNDFELLMVNGGSLTVEEWDVRNGNFYTRIEGPLVFPSKAEYIKKKNRKG